MLPAPVIPIFWLVGVLLLYAAAAAGVVLFATALRAGEPPHRAGALLLLAAECALFFLPGTLRPVALPGAALLCLAADFVFYLLALRPRINWRILKSTRETVRQTALHLVLLSGSALFLLPFVWLVVTSLKEDSEMSRFPPVWIPTQQVTQEIDGKSRKLATATYLHIPVKVAVLKEFETGARDVRVLEPAALAGTSFHCKGSDLTAIRVFAPVWKNYPDALKFLPQETRYGLVFLGNTLQVSLLGILGTLLASAMVAYSFARLRWPGRDLLFLVLLATMMIPGAVTMMPLFLIFRSLGWIDTLKPLWVPAFFGSAFNIFLLRQFFLGIPGELEDAAKIDGCSHYGIFWRIMLPQVKPALAAITIMAFMGAWNDFRGPLIYISSPEKEPLAYALQLFQTAHGGEPGLLMAASTLVMLPVLVLFFFTQRYFIQGITLTGIKG